MIRFLLLPKGKKHLSFGDWFGAAGTDHTNQRAHLGAVHPAPSSPVCHMENGCFSFLPKLQRVTSVEIMMYAVHDLSWARSLCCLRTDVTGKWPQKNVPSKWKFLWAHWSQCPYFLRLLKKPVCLGGGRTVKTGCSKLDKSVNWVFVFIELGLGHGSVARQHSWRDFWPQDGASYLGSWKQYP